MSTAPAAFRLAALRPWFGAAVLAALAYLSITGFTLDAHEYFARVTTNIFVAAATVMLWIVAEGGRGLSLDARGRLWVAAVLASTIASSLLAPRWTLAWDRLQLYYSLVLLGLSIYLLHRDDGSTAPRPLSPYLWAIALVHAVVLVDVVFWMWAASSGDPSTQRMPYHSNIRHFGYLGYLAAAAALALTLQGGRAHLTALLLCAAALWGIVHLGSRGALLGWLVFLAAGAAFLRQRVRLLALGLVATALAMGLSWGMASYGITGSGNLIARAEHGELTGGSGRLSLWSDVSAAIAKKPVLGYGADGHRVIGCCGSYGPYVGRTSQPHNVLLQLLEEFGVVGVLLIVALVVHLARRHAPAPQCWRRLARQEPDVGSLVAILCGALAFGMVDGPFYYPVPLLIMAALTGLLMAAAGRARSLGSE